MMRAAIVGGSGYVGGELLRLLLRHGAFEVTQVTSERHRGRWVHARHPHLRGHTDLQFVGLDQLEPCDLLVLALPHGEAARRIDEFARLAPRIVDCSADFRSSDGAAYERWYGEPHPAPAWLDRFVYGLPELDRGRIAAATHVSGVGCNATASILALLPFAKAGLLPGRSEVVVEVKVGSSEGGREVNEGSHHPERSRTVRSYAPVGHRHTAEVHAALGEGIHLSLTAVEMVRGCLATAHVFPGTQLSERDLWRIYRDAYGAEPFVRVVHERQGLHRHPDPKVLIGTNHADVGFATDESTGRVVAFCAIDNLMKGAAGTAVQCLNLMVGEPERRGLELIGAHPS